MLRRLTSIFFAVAGISIFVGCASNAEFVRESSRIAVSPGYHNTNKRVGVLYEVNNFNADHIWFQQMFTQQLIANGYTVVERLHMDAIFKELQLDNSGAIKGSDSTFQSSQGFNKSTLKKIGEMYGIKYMIWFGQRSGTDAYVRVINLETAEIGLIATMNLMASGSYLSFIPNIMPITLADAIAFADNNSDKVSSPLYITTLDHGSNSIGWNSVQVFWRRDLGNGSDIAIWRAK